jgi:hypothetical protein
MEGDFVPIFVGQAARLSGCGPYALIPTRDFSIRTAHALGRLSLLPC